MKSFKKVSIVMLCCFSFFSCLKEEKTNIKIKDENVKSVDDKKSESSTSKSDKSFENITITTWLSDGNRNHQSWETPQDSRWTRVIKDELGVNFKYIWIAGSDVGTKIQTSISSGDIPEFMHSLNYSVWYEMASRGMLADITDAYEKYSSPLLKSSLEYYDDDFKKLISLNGKIYGLASPPDGMFQMLLGWVRKDWLDKLGVQAPKTNKEFFDLLYKFKTEDPDGDGVDNSIGLALNRISEMYSGIGLILPIFEMYHAYPGAWIKKDGKVVWGDMQDEVLEPLKKLAKMYEDGIISKDFYTYDPWDSSSVVIKPKAGITLAPPWLPDGLQYASYKADKSIWIPFKLKDIDENDLTHILKIITPSTTFVAMKKDTKHPDFLPKYWSFIMDKTENEFGFPKDEKTGKVREDQNFVDYGGAFPTYKRTLSVNIAKALEAKDDSYIKKPRTKVFYDQIKDYLDGNMDYASAYYTRGPGQGFDIGNELFFDKKMYIKDAYTGPMTKLMVKSMTPINSKKDEIFVNIITGQISAEEGLQNLRYYWNSNGGPEIEKEVNDWVAKNS